MTISALRALQDEENPGPRPQAPHLGPRPAPSTTLAAPAPQPAPAAPAAPGASYDIDELLAFAFAHDDLDVRKDAERVANGLERLRARMAADTELALLDKKREELLAELAAVNDRSAEIRPPKAKTTKGKTNPATAAIRAWAADNGHEVGKVGRIPQEIQDAYYAANPTLAPTTQS